MLFYRCIVLSMKNYVLVYYIFICIDVYSLFINKLILKLFLWCCIILFILKFLKWIYDIYVFEEYVNIYLINVYLYFFVFYLVIYNDLNVVLK